MNQNYDGAKNRPSFSVLFRRRNAFSCPTTFFTKQMTTPTTPDTAGNRTTSSLLRPDGSQGQNQASSPILPTSANHVESGGFLATHHLADRSVHRFWNHFLGRDRERIPTWMESLTAVALSSCEHQLPFVPGTMS